VPAATPQPDRPTPPFGTGRVTPQRRLVTEVAAEWSGAFTVEELAAAHHIYPSWGEGVKAAAEQALRTKHLRAGTGAFRS